MATNIQKLRFGDADVLVSTLRLPGTEPTGAADRVRERAVDALERAQSAIESVARSGADTVRRLTALGTVPSSLEIELSLAFTAEGGVLVAGVGVEASMVVHLTYDLSDRAQGVAALH